MNKNEMHIGMEVWFENSYGTICSGNITEFPENAPDYVLINGTRDTFGSTGAKIEDCYKTKEELSAAIQRKNREHYDAYCAEITDANTLVAFMYNHTVSCAEEYTDWDARRAVKTRAKQLLKLDLK